MAASVQIRPHNRNLGMVMREVDEDLAIFLGIRSVQIDDGRDAFDDSRETAPAPDGLLGSTGLQPGIVQIGDEDDFLNLEMDTSDYDWLCTQTDPTSLPSVESGVSDHPVTIQTEISDVKKSEADISDTTDSAPSGDQKPAFLRSSTPTSKSKLVPSKSTASHGRSSTPVGARPRSSTPVGARPRSSTPVGRPALSSGAKSAPRKVVAPSTTSLVPSSDLSSSIRKTGPAKSKNPLTARRPSPSLRSSRPLNPSVIAASSHDVSENSNMSMSKRPVSASRGRASAPAAMSPSSKVKRRQKSCSPAKTRAPVSPGSKIGNTRLSKIRGHYNDEDYVNPVVMGTKMVERVVNMRKLAPPKQLDGHTCRENSKKSSVENLGFGRSLSKKSLDMAIRHMDITRTVSDYISPREAGTKSSSSAKCSIVRALKSPLTSSVDSSKSSMNMNSSSLDGTETDDCTSSIGKCSDVSSQ